MEQIVTTFGINSKLLVIQVINFGILLFLLHRFLYRPLLKLMNERQEKIEQGLSDAKNASAELADASAKHAEMVAQAKDEAREIVDKAIAASEKMKDGILREAEEKSREILSAAEKQAQEETRRVVEEAKKEVGAFAILAVEKILHEKVGEQEERHHIKKAIHE